MAYSKTSVFYSIIVPVYNVEKYLVNCLDSIINQTYKNFEIIIINDGSTDNSYSILENYAQNYPNLIRVFSKENGGLGSARNLGIQKAVGRFLWFIDSDDWIEVDALFKLYNVLKNNDFNVLVFDFNIIEEKKKKKKKKALLEKILKILKKGF